MRGVEQIPWLYDAAMAVIEKTGLRRWRAWLAGGAPPGHVLDLGCGTGRNLPLFGSGVRAIGLDPSPSRCGGLDAEPPVCPSCARAPKRCRSATAASTRS